MDTKDLIEYVDMIADMENSNYVQQSLITELESYSTTLGIPHAINEPIMPTIEVTTKKKGPIIKL